MVENNNNDNEDSPTPLSQITYLLRKYKLVEGLDHLQDSPDNTLTNSSVQKQNLAELQELLDSLHPADIAHILEALPLNDRLLIWATMS